MVTKEQAERALQEVARQLGKSVPTGHEAALNARGPELVMDWAGDGGGHPTILLEGGRFTGWACRIDLDAVGRAAGEDVWCDIWDSYAIQLFD